MTYAIRIVGLREVQRMLGTDIKPALRAATQAIALEVQGEIAPYPASTIANSPSNPTGRWYERGYGPKWRRKDGSVRGRKTSEMLGRSGGLTSAGGRGNEGKWRIRQSGSIGHILGNRASYAEYVHSEDKQARFHRARGWITDKAALQNVIRSGAVKRILTQAIMHRLRGRG